jgi:hypothetical protein
MAQMNPFPPGPTTTGVVVGVVGVVGVVDAGGDGAFGNATSSAQLGAVMASRTYTPLISLRRRPVARTLSPGRRRLFRYTVRDTAVQNRPAVIAPNPSGLIHLTVPGAFVLACNSFTISPR